MAKILIVDDLLTEIEVMRSAVNSLGHSCIIANDGEQAIETCKREQPNLVLLDVVLPKMDGFKACRLLKRDPETAHIPIIIVSSKSQESDRFWGEKQGATAYIFKPINKEELAAMIRQHLN